MLLKKSLGCKNRNDWYHNFFKDTNNIKKIFIFFLTSGNEYSSNSIELSSEDRVIKHLLRKYAERGKFGRPVQKYSDIINVTFGLQLVQIMNLDERKQILTLNVWTNYVSTHKQLEIKTLSSETHQTFQTLSFLQPLTDKFYM